MLNVFCDLFSLIKLPHIHQPLPFDEELRDRDMIQKEKGKMYTDEKRHAKQNEIEVGDKVWLKKLININKLSANFEPIDYKVIERSGSELVVENVTTGVKYRRNVTHVKKIVSRIFFSFFLQHSV